MAQEEKLESKTDEVIEAAVGRAPWGWGTLLITAFLGSIGAAGIIAGLNWRRVGFNNLMWPTIIISIIVLIVLNVIAASNGFGVSLSVVSLVAVWGLILWQRSYYLMWKTINPEAQRAGW